MKQWSRRCIRGFIWGVVLIIYAPVLCAASTNTLTILFTGNTHGLYDASPVSNVNGAGLARRAAKIKELQKKYSPILLVDTGSVMPAATDSAIGTTIINCYHEMHYDAVGIGESDFINGAKWLVENSRKIPLTALNMHYCTDIDCRSIGNEVIYKTVGDIRVAIVNIISPQRYTHYTRMMHIQDSSHVDVSHPIKMLRAFIEHNTNEIVIVISHLGMSHTIRLARRIPGIDVIIDAAADNKTLSSPRHIGATMIVGVGSSMADIGRLKLIADAAGSVLAHEYETIPVPNAQLPDDTIQTIIEKYTAAVTAQHRAVVDTIIHNKNTNTIQLILISEPDCSHCREIRDIWVELWESEYNVPIELSFYDITDEVSMQILKGLAEYHHLGDYRFLEYPMAFIGDTALIGGDKVDTGIAGVIQQLADRIHRGESIPVIDIAQARKSLTDDIGSVVKTIPLGVVILLGLSDGINPCAFATIIFLISYLSMIKRSRKEILLIGGAYTSSVFAAYLLISIIGFNALHFISQIPYVSIAIQIILILLTTGLFIYAVKDVVLVYQGHSGDMTLQLPKKLKAAIHKQIREKSRMGNYILGAILIGFTVSSIELVCTGQVLLPFLKMVLQFSIKELTALGIPVIYWWKALVYILIYCIMFIIPLIAVFMVVYFGTTSKQLETWFKRHLGIIKITVALVFLALAVYLIINLVSVMNQTGLSGKLLS